MIHPDSRTIAWIEQVAQENHAREKVLIEKAIRAFSLLEALVRSGCPLLFKGGTSLMLHLNSAKRLSIDVDIICPPGTPIEDYLEKYSKEYGFGEVKLVERISITDVPKKHAKFFYQVAYPSGVSQDKILLDVLFEENHYNKVVSLPIEGRFIKTMGDPVKVNLPSYEDLLGDKLTAFAPHTTGIPFFKGEKNCSMEISKQLYDISSLFDLTNDLSITADTFRKFASIELQYRKMESSDIQPVLDDIFQTALCISLRGQNNPNEFKLLQDGISRVRGFIHSELYNIDSAIINAAKAAYLSKLIEKGINDVEHYDISKNVDLANASVKASIPTKLNKLKKTNPEAFYYWMKTSELTGM